MLQVQACFADELPSKVQKLLPKGTRYVARLAETDMVSPTKNIHDFCASLKEMSRMVGEPFHLSVAGKNRDRIDRFLADVGAELKLQGHSLGPITEVPREARREE